MNESLVELQRMIKINYPLISRDYSNVNSNQKIIREAKDRELIQFIALLGLSKSGFFEKAAFYGGTALRILYGLDRFSEDLDFTLLKPSPFFDITPFLEGICKEVSLFGLSMKAERKQKTAKTGVISAFLKTNSIQFNLAIGNEAKKINHNEEIKIKLEVDTNPPDHLFELTQQRLKVPESFAVSTISLSELFAGKMHAALYRKWQNRVKGRDWYDVVWYINNNTPLNMKFFISCLRQSGELNNYQNLDRSDFIKQSHEKIKQIDWELAKDDVLNFIPERKDSQLEQWSGSFFSQLIEKIQFQ